MPSVPPTFLSLYSGAGGMDLGFADTGFRCLWANDVDPDAVATHRAHLEGVVAIGDVLMLRPQLTELALRPDVVIGGPPCQGFSVAGHMRPDDPRSQHVWTFLDVVEEHQPQIFVMENVAALAVNSRWLPLREALMARAGALGYGSAIWVLDASHFGVPQARRRMFLVGVRGRAALDPPVPTSALNPPTVREALAVLPEYGAPGNDGLCTAKVTPARRPVLRRSPYAGMLFNGKGRTLNLDAPALTLPASMGGNRTPVLDQHVLDGRASENWISQYHARLMAGRHPVGRIPRRMRRLTVQEASAIQTFPSSWAFSGAQSSQFRQIGNAVPPVLARAVAQAVLGGLVVSAEPSCSHLKLAAYP